MAVKETLGIGIGFQLVAIAQTFDLVRVFETKKKGSGILGKIRVKKEKIVAADHLNIAIEKGELFGLVGPNGAGKTTTIKMLSTLLLPTSGTAVVAGHDIVKEPGMVRRKINVVLGGERAFYWRLTGRENLWAFSQFYNIPGKRANERIDEVLELVELKERADSRVEEYSKGMKQRLHIARALLNDPEVLFLDEPTLGLDPDGARKVRNHVRKLISEKGVTILLTTHYMSEAEELCDRVAIINKGKIIALDTPKELKKIVSDTNVLELNVKGVTEEIVEALKGVSGILNALNKRRADSNMSKLRLQTDGRGEVVAEVTETLVRRGAKILSFQTLEPTLEDVFIKLVGEGIE